MCGGTLEHMGNAGTGERGGSATVWWVDLLVGFKLGEEGVEGAKVFEGGGGVEIEDGGE